MCVCDIWHVLLMSCLCRELPKLEEFQVCSHVDMFNMPAVSYVYTI